MASSKKTLVVSKGQIDSMIRSIRGVRIMLDSDLAAIYGVSTSRFNEAVKRNKNRFPADFMFQLTGEENASLRSQFAILKTGRGRHRRARWIGHMGSNDNKISDGCRERAPIELEVC
jgi:hypothetical protein